MVGNSTVNTPDANFTSPKLDTVVGETGVVALTNVLAHHLAHAKWLFIR